METETVLADAQAPQAGVHEPVTDGLLTDELLIEEISIDGMCGVY